MLRSSDLDAFPFTMLRSLTLLLCLSLSAGTVRADTAEPQAGHETGHGDRTAARSPYAEETGRDIASLSAEDIAQLRSGAGWGLARAAELNGMPGPIHLLELAEELELDDGQVREIRALYEAMRAEAIPAGEALIRREAALDELFRSGTVDEASLGTAVRAAGEARAALREVHLAAHLATPALLSDAQRRRYDELRGYADAADPCENVPAGHDAAMWRKHNGCAP